MSESASRALPHTFIERILMSAFRASSSSSHARIASLPLFRPSSALFAASARYM